MSSFNSLEKNLIKNRLWPAVLTFVLYFLYHVAALTIGITSNTQIYYRREIVNYMLGGDGFEFIAPLVAAILAMSGFYYLDSSKQLDFFMSEPYTKRQRFFALTFQNFAIFILSYVITVIFGLLIASGFSLNGFAAAAETGFLRALVLFAGYYFLAVLAVMLTGNIGFAICAFIILSIYELLLKECIVGLEVSYLKTIAGNDSINLFTVPYWYYIKNGGKSLISGTVLALVFSVLSYIAYIKRKTEAAGKTVVFKWLKNTIKFLSVFLCVLMAELVGGEINRNNIYSAVILTVVTALVVGCVMEICFERKFKALFKHFYITIIGMICAVLILASVKYDWYGYDSWVPKTEDVSYAAFYSSVDMSNDAYITKNGAVSREYYMEKYFKLYDIDTINELLLSGEKFMKEGHDTINNYNNVVSIIFIYHMKSGRVVKRKVDVPIKGNESKFDKITGSDEYKNQYFQFCNSEVLDEDKDKLECSFYDNVEKMDPEMYAELRDAYKKDLKKFDFTFARENEIEYVIEIQDMNKDGKYATHDEYNDITSGFIKVPVYSSYENTIKVLKKYGTHKMFKYRANDIIGPFTE